MANISIHLGQYGNQLGCSFFETLTEQCSHDYLRLNNKFFRYSSNNILIPRSVCADLEPKVIDSLATLKSPHFSFDPYNFLSSSCGASNNWAVGYTASDTIDLVLSRVRKEAERADSLSTILLFQSLAGGTGSGLGSAVMTALSDQLSDTLLLAQVVFPNTGGEVIVHSYNAILSLARLLDCCDGIISTSNAVASEIVQKVLKIKNPSLHDLNSVLSFQLGSVLCPGSGTLTLEEICCYAFPSPSCKIANTYVNPIMPKAALEFTNNKWEALISQQKSIILSNNYLSQCVSYSKKGKLLSCLSNLWGKDSFAFVNSSCSSFTPLLSSPMSSCSTGWSSDNFLGVEKLIGSLSVCSGVANYLEPICSSASRMLSSNAYVHHYAEFGVDEGVLANSIASVESVKSRYLELET
ncbi:hypothetical protein GEMRC1_004623 [Eukaryota sp. GEM-RC1]